MARRGTALKALLAASFAAAAPSLFANEGGFIGLLRARDLSPFGFLRLDMRPAHAVSGPAGTWSFETELAYQNTWALSPQVEQYLKSLPGRRELGPAELDAIRALPGENYLVDLELAQLDFTLHYRFTEHWSAYAILSGASYHGGFLDSTIEGFHDEFGFGDFGRPATKRNDVNIIFDLKGTQSAVFEAPTDGGVLDPTFGVRYSGFRMPRAWNVVLEAAAKVPVQGFRPYLSTGRTDFGVQASLQKFFSSSAFYVSASGVYYDGSLDNPRTQPQVVPTLVVGWEQRITRRTYAILQGYASKSIYEREDTDLDELLEDKYQISLGLYRHFQGGAFTFAITENTQNLHNTPDIGFQLGWVFSPGIRRTGGPDLD